MRSFQCAFRFCQIELYYRFSRFFTVVKAIQGDSIDFDNTTHDCIWWSFRRSGIFTIQFDSVSLDTLSGRAFGFVSLHQYYSDTHKIDNNLFIMANSNDNRPNMFEIQMKKNKYFYRVALDLLLPCVITRSVYTTTTKNWLVFSDDFFLLLFRLTTWALIESWMRDHRLRRWNYTIFTSDSYTFFIRRSDFNN